MGIRKAIFFAVLCAASGQQVQNMCDENGTLTSYLCTNMTFFSPITLACDYVSNVECQKFSQYVGLSSSRLYSTAAAATNLIAMPSPAPKAPAPSPGIDKAAATAANTGTATAAV
ncbi:uncharacterized protein LOC129596891 isoform X2 [Paramacrobiotus metropolitanus]|uniref:uncharacterized protein LOC129596891 isoform X2 n=1 Tax=Paramacrobiotus metropolitanus TaxID=2943436 RepID=UPI002445D3A0|nr:uncharacterized protein LOC129596891 isoform X2 [Paramacrobiotus metropolitanus]